MTFYLFTIQETKTGRPEIRPVSWLALRLANDLKQIEHFNEELMENWI
jgi:hypothetical protein